MGIVNRAEACIMTSRNINLKNRSISNTSRDEADRSVKQFKSDCRKMSSGTIAAVYRVKNGADTLLTSMRSIAYLVDEIIIVDNQSKDNLKNVVEAFKREYPVPVKLFEYDTQLARAGENYHADIKNGYGSLSDYYNFAFSKAESEYLLKVDSHYVFIPKIIKPILKKLNKKPLFLRLYIKEIFGREHGFEPLIFRKDSDWSYKDSAMFEKLVIREYAELNKIRKIYNNIRNSIYLPAVLHIKRLRGDRDEE
jgi:cellulose synthase/poly-beta-1,6-N-acetylglucosamine synthase-like glycosyltransferase